MSINDTFGNDVRPWLNLAEELRALDLESELNIPQICVMGDQSSGKSSVLEALSGIPFPRGSGLVTRCPTRLVMRQTRGDETWNATVCTSKEPDRKFPVKNVSELSAIIERATNFLCQGSEQFSTESIIVDLVSPDASDLTVVDLPGIIRTVTAGQSVDVIDQVNKLIKSFLMDKRTIILAVIPANQDIATVDILERAQGVDPHGERTLGVLTKVDLINPGGEDEVLAVVRNIRKPLALGYVMVKNRSQKEISENIPNKKARQNEIAFFKGHPVFNKIDPQCCGVDQLAHKLTRLLVSRIQIELAPMKARVEKELGLARTTVRSLSAFAIPKTPSDRQKLLVVVMQEYLRHLTDAIRGEYRDRIMVQNQKLRLYTFALKSFEDFQNKINDSAPKFKEQEIVDSLSVQIDKLKGRELPGFLSSQAFYMCMTQFVELWSAPMRDMLLEVRVIAQDVSACLADILVIQYPNLREAIAKEASIILSEAVEKCIRKLDDVILREKDPFTLNDFLQQWVNKLRFDRFSDAVDDCFDKVSSGEWDEMKDEIFENMRVWYRETHSVSPQANAKDMAAIMEAYWNLSARRFVDNACMTADLELLGQLTVSMQDHMYRFVRDDIKLEGFFSEDPAMAQRRDAASARRERLMNASSILSGMTVGGGAAGPKNVPGAGPTAAAASTKSSEVQDKKGASAESVAKNMAVGGETVLVDGTSYKKISATVVIGDYGMGLIVSDADTKKMVIKGFRPMPSPSMPNPGKEAGLQEGDVIDQINGTKLNAPTDAVTLLKGKKGNIYLSVLRRT